MDVIMDEVPNRNRFLQKEVDKLTALLQLSERKRLNQKVLYDKNLENLHEKLADFENVLLKEQKEIQVRLQKKDEQIKVREDLANALQNKLDSQFCRQCGYPTSKNKFDTDWEINICDEKKTQYRKLPPLSLPLPENLPNVSFANRQFHCKNKLSPVAEECEVASSSYLRNIHADQNPDRFHAVLTASLECLQVDHVKKNITPESEYPEEIIDTPNGSDTNNFNDLSHVNQINPRKLDMVESLDSLQVCDKYYPPRPSIVIESCSIDDIKMEEPGEAHENISEYADGVAISVLEIVYDNLRKNDKKSVKEKNIPISCIQSFSSDLAFGILRNMGSDITSRDKSSSSNLSVSKETCSDNFEDDGYKNSELISNMDDDWNPALIITQPSTENNSNIISEHENSHKPDSPKIINGDVYIGNEFSFENHKLEDTLSDEDANSLCNHSSQYMSNTTTANDVAPSNGENGNIPLLETLTDKPRSYSRICTSKLAETNKPSYSRLSTMVVPLVDQAMLVAKTIVRRRSSTNFLAIDSFNEPEEKGKVLERVEDMDDQSMENLSFNKKILIELIDQAVENVIPTVNCSKDNDINNLLNSSATNGIAQPDNFLNSENHNGIDGAIYNNGDITLVDGETLSGFIASETSVTENKENEISKSKKKKNKKKKKKKKASVSDAGNRLPESVDQKETAAVNLKDKIDIPLVTDCNLDFSFDSSDVVTSSLNNSESEINTIEPALSLEEDKFSLAVDESFNEMEASRGSTPDTLDGLQ